jgi:hypothetical protein
VWQQIGTLVFRELLKLLTSGPSSPRSKYGLQVDAWGAFIPDRGYLEIELQDRVTRKMQAKGLGGLAIKREKLKLGDPVSVGGGWEAREHIVFVQNLRNGGKATLALRIAKRGVDDLEISWRLSERNILTAWFRVCGPFFSVLLICLVMGLLLSSTRDTISGLCVLFFGLLMMLGVLTRGLSGLGKLLMGGPTASTYQQFDTRVLAVTVDHALMLSLEEVGVEPRELRVLRQAQIEGIGRLYVP